MLVYNVQTRFGKLTNIETNHLIDLIKCGHVRGEDLIELDGSHIWKEVQKTELATFLPNPIGKPQPAARPAATPRGHHVTDNWMRSLSVSQAISESTAQGVYRDSAATLRERAFDWNTLTLWLLVVSPLIATFIRLIIKYVQFNSGLDIGMTDDQSEVWLSQVVLDSSYWWVTPAISIGLSYVNLHFLKQSHGIERQSIGRFAFIVPLYLYKRAVLLNTDKRTMWIWIGLYAATILFWAAIAAGAHASLVQ